MLFQCNVTNFKSVIIFLQGKIKINQEVKKIEVSKTINNYM